MNVVFYTFAKKDNSTKRPAGGTTFNCVLKDSSGVLSPEIEISTSGNPSAYNYAYISDFGRYYYVSEWTYFRGTWTASLRVDALASWRGDIGGSTLYILRSSSTAIWNKYVVDNKYPMKNYIMNKYNVAASSPWNGGTIVLGIIGDASHGQGMGAVNYYALSPAQASTFFNWLMGNTGGYLNALDAVFSYTFDEVFRANYNPFQYIASAHYFPFEITESYISQTSMVVGKIPFANGPGIGNVKLLTTMPTQTLSGVSIPIPIHDQVTTRGDYLMSPPFSHYVLQFEPFGNIELDGSQLEPNGTITATGIVDLITGKSLLYLSATGPSTATVELGTYQAVVGCDIQIGQITSNFFENLKDKVSDIVQAGMVENYFGVAMACIGIVTDTRYQLSSAGCDGSILPYAIHNPVLHVYYRPLVDEDLDHMGRPVCKMGTLSNYPGFLICAEGDIDTNATLAEKEVIKSALTSGFFYE